MVVGFIMGDSFGLWRSSTTTYGTSMPGAGVVHCITSAAPVYQLLFVFNQFGDPGRSLLREGHVHSAEEWQRVLEPALARCRERGIAISTSAPMRPSPSPRSMISWSKKASATQSVYRPTRFCNDGSAIC